MNWSVLLRKYLHYILQDMTPTWRIMELFLVCFEVRGNLWYTVNDFLLETFALWAAEWPVCTVYLIFSMSPLPLQIAIHAFCNYLHILCHTTCISDWIFIFKLLFYALLFSRSYLPFHMSSGSRLEPEHHTKIGNTKGLWSWEHQILKLRYVKVPKNKKGSQLCLCRRFELIIE